MPAKLQQIASPGTSALRYGRKYNRKSIEVRHCLGAKNSQINDCFNLLSSFTSLERAGIKI